MLEELVATTFLLFGSVAGPAVVLWLTIALHEIAHAAATWCVGGRVVEIRIGGGRHVRPMRWFGVRWELRPWPTHGQVLPHLPVDDRYRAKMLVILLAGPLASTAAASGMVSLWSATRYGMVLPGFSFWRAAALMTLSMAAPACVIHAIAAWLPAHWRIAGTTVPSDILSAYRLLRADAEQLADLASQQAAGFEYLERWHSFLDGRHEEALRSIRAAGSAQPSFELLFAEALHVWPVAGGAEAFRVLRQAEREFAVSCADPPKDASSAGRCEPGRVREFAKLFLVNRAFFAVVSGSPELLVEAAAATEEMVRRFPRDPAVQRTAGFVELHRGRVGEGLRHLRAAWSAAEPPWARALTALYLAFGSSLLHRRKDAARWLRKAERLHPECVLLPDYRARIVAGGATARRVAGR